MARRKALAASLFAALFVTPAAAAEAPGSPEEVYAAIIDIWPLIGEYSATYMEPECFDEDKDLICLGASVLIQKGGIERFIGEPLSRADDRLRSASGRDTDGSYIRLRMIAGHAAIRVPDGRYLAVVEPTDEGYVFVQWREPIRGGRACFPGDVLEHYGDRLVLELGPPDSEGRRCEI